MSASSIPFFSTAAANRDVDLQGAIDRVLRSNRFVLGDEVEGFEREFAAYIGTEHCVGVGNGTDALELALRASGVQAGDRVIVAANAGFYGATALRLLGAEPVYVDVDDATLTLSPAACHEALRSQPKAAIVTHLYGQLADMDALMPMLASEQVAVIEDCAQAHGASRRGRRAGQFGQFGCFSFYPTKNLGALGDGGAIVTSDGAAASRLRGLRQYGWHAKYDVGLSGGRNSRLDEMQAAILRAKLPLLDAKNRERQSIARRYSDGFEGLPLRCPQARGDEGYVAHLYVIRAAERDRLRTHLQRSGITTDIHYPIADHQQAIFRNDFANAHLPVTEAACAQCLSLPCFPGLPNQDVDVIIESVQRYFESRPLE